MKATKTKPASLISVRRKFHVVITVEAEMELDETAIAQELRDGYILGKGCTERDVINHLAYNLVGNSLAIHEIDGWANSLLASAVVKNRQMDVEAVDEIKEKTR